MKKTLMIFALLYANVTLPVFAQGADVYGLTVGYVYQFDSSNSTVFDINIPARPHACGTTIYRSSSNSDAIANRKFTLVVTAFTANKKIAFRETGECEGNRMKVAWIRLTN